MLQPLIYGNLCLETERGPSIDDYGPVLMEPLIDFLFAGLPVPLACGAGPLIVMLARRVPSTTTYLPVVHSTFQQAR